jgi:TrmH family RNA methyltransferase
MLSLDDAKKLHQKKYREEFGAFLVEGEHLVLELINALPSQPCLADAVLFVTDEYATFQSPFRTHLISAKHMSQLSDTKTPQGIIAAVPTLSLQGSHTERAIYLHEVQDPGNLGTIIRTLGWFGGFRLLLSEQSVDPFNPKVVRSSMGAIFHVPIERDVDLSSLPSRFSQIAALDMNGQSISSPSFIDSTCLIFGNEARGLPQEAIDTLKPTRYTIKGSGMIESLNLATAVNLCVYEIHR